MEVHEDTIEVHEDTIEVQVQEEALQQMLTFLIHFLNKTNVQI